VRLSTSHQEGLRHCIGTAATSVSLRGSESESEATLSLFCVEDMSNSSLKEMECFSENPGTAGGYCMGMFSCYRKDIFLPHFFQFDLGIQNLQLSTSHGDHLSYSFGVGAASLL